jgi:hypothetical protein
MIVGKGYRTVTGAQRYFVTYSAPSDEVLVIEVKMKKKNIKIVSVNKSPPLWYSGQSSWLQIRRPGFDSRHYQKKK